MVNVEQPYTADKNTPSQANSTPQLPVFASKVNETKLPLSTQVGNFTVEAQLPVQMQNFSLLPTSNSSTTPVNISPGATIASQNSNIISNRTNITSQNTPMPTSYCIMTTTSGQTVLMPAGLTLCEAPMSLAMQPLQNSSLNTANSYNTNTTTSNNVINNNGDNNINSGIVNNTMQQPVQLVNLSNINKTINNNENVTNSSNIASGNAHTLVSCNPLQSYPHNLLALQQ